MLKFADIFNKEPNFNPMQFIRNSSYISTPKNPLKGRVGGPEARMSTVLPEALCSNVHNFSLVKYAAPIQ